MPSLVVFNCESGAKVKLKLNPRLHIESERMYFFEDNIASKNNITRLIIATDISIPSHNILSNSLISITSDSYTSHHFRHFISSLYVNTC